jgi:hypothetical protein
VQVEERPSAMSHTRGFGHATLVQTGITGNMLCTTYCRICCLGIYVVLEQENQERQSRFWFLRHITFT